MPADPVVLGARRERAAAACSALGIAAIVIGPGSDLSYLTGYRIAASERLTCLVLTSSGEARLVVPALEAPRARGAVSGIDLVEWHETDDPCKLAASCVGARGDVAIGDQLWATFVVRLQAALGDRTPLLASTVTSPLRMRKDAQELGALRAAAGAADRAYARVIALPFAGRRERDVGEDLARLMKEEGHEAVAFTIVAAGPNGASPHHEAGDRPLGSGDAVVLDFGGTLEGYCSAITRTVVVGQPTAEVTRVHDLVRRAQEAAYAAAGEGVAAESVDAAALDVIRDAGYGDRFIHRLGHGIGLDGHEHPYLVSGNRQPLEAGMAFSIEPGVYLPGLFGVRIEDIAALGSDGRPVALNKADRALAIVR
ncbi:aminopeptidase P family protein [soil metagenome]